MTRPQAASSAHPAPASAVTLDSGRLGRTEWASAGRPYGNERNSGDRWVVADAGGRALLAVIDGLGHGAGAYEAASRAVETLSRDPRAPLETLIARCHRAMLETRGATVSLVSLGSAGQLTWLGVGNVAAHVVGTGPAGPELRASAILSAGIVGYRLPGLLHPANAVLAPDELLLLTSDGIDDGHLEGVDLTRPVTLIAQHILAQHSKITDDALVLVARQRDPL